MTWAEIMNEYMKSTQYKELHQKVIQEYKTHEIFPPIEQIFNAINTTPYENVKCVIIGQDPYHDNGQAMGLSFSVNDGIKIPPSLKNIYKEIHNEYGYEMSNNGNLMNWARQGVLLLNSILTVRAHEPASHKNIGWEEFTDEVLKALNKKETPVVFMLWGNFAKSKEHLITNPRHLILKSGHPSPLSCRYFLGNNHFKSCNDFLEKNHMSGIDWKN